MSKQAFQELQRIFGKELIADQTEEFNCYSLHIPGNDLFGSTADKGHALADAHENIAAGMVNFSNALKKLGVRFKFDWERGSTEGYVLFDQNEIEQPAVIRYLKTVQAGVFNYLWAMTEGMRDQADEKTRLTETILWRFNSLGKVQFKLDESEQNIVPSENVSNAMGAAYMIADALDVHIDFAVISKGPGVFAIPLDQIEEKKLAGLRDLSEKVEGYLTPALS